MCHVVAEPIDDASDRAPTEPSSSADENEADEQHGNKRQRVAAGGKELSVKNEVLSPPSQVNAFELIEAN